MSQTAGSPIDAYFEAIEALREALIRAEVEYVTLPKNVKRWVYSPAEVAKGENPKAVPLRAPDNPAWPLTEAQVEEALVELDHLLDDMDETSMIDNQCSVPIAEFFGRWVEHHKYKQVLDLIEHIIANYRDGQGANGLFTQLDHLSQEWERLGLPCAIPKHGRRDRLADIEPGF